MRYGNVTMERVAEAMTEADGSDFDHHMRKMTAGAAVLNERDRAVIEDWLGSRNEGDLLVALHGELIDTGCSDSVFRVYDGEWTEVPHVVNDFICEVTAAA